MSLIYTGLWVNWSHGAILGSTLTLKARDGGLLTAFLALFVSFAGAATWKVMRYALHQYRVKQGYHDGLHHQRQAILRNCESPIGASWRLVQLSWYWRNNAKKSVGRTFPLAVLALLNVGLFGLAGVFSSQVTKTPGNEVLIKSTNCGVLNVTDPMSFEGLAAAMVVDRVDTGTATSYQRACYNDTQNSIQCARFIQEQLYWTIDRNAPCPFSPRICLSNGTAAYKMDTGLIDSHDGLGINAPRKDRLRYRKVTSCSPIQMHDYVNITKDTDTRSPTYGDNFVQYFYGPMSNFSYTYMYNEKSFEGNNGYQLTSVFAPGGVNIRAPSWSPIPALELSDADVSIFFLAPNSVSNEAPVNDPFFGAHIPKNLSIGTGPDMLFYMTDHWVNALGCTDQHQFCAPTTGKCTELTAASPLYDEIHAIGLNDAQLSTALRLHNSVSSMDTYSSVASLGASALRASETVYKTVYETVQIPLPDNQWITEVSSWFAVSLVKLQQRTLQYATGPPVTPNGSVLIRPPDEDKEGKKICKNQIVRSQGFTISFSVLGLGIILIVGGLLIIMSLVIDTLGFFIRRTFHRKEYKSLQWALDENLQLQRMAYEEAGQGLWSGCAGTVPVTEKGDKIGIPRPVDEEHPRLNWTRGQPEQIDIDGDEIAEGDGLMARKKMNHRVKHSVRSM